MPGKRSDAILPAMVDPSLAVSAMLERVFPVGTERVSLSEATGRVLAEPVLAERDSPAANVSAMDGYALSWDALQQAFATSDADETWIDVAFEVQTGAVPAALMGETDSNASLLAARVFTGGVVPEGADTVIRREAVMEEAQRVRVDLATAEALSPGQHVRRRGENAAAGDVLLEPGCRIDPSCLATLAGNGQEEVTVFRRLRVGVAVTGNELVSGGGRLGDGAVRDSNGPALRGLLEPLAWCEAVESVALPDDREATVSALRGLVERCDVVLTTGGVSMGDHDWLPDAVVGLGARAVYHHLAMRPGKPNLGAVMPDGVPVLCLPGNPVSALVGAVVLAGPVLRKRAGILGFDKRLRVAVELRTECPVASRPTQLWQYVPATVTESGAACPLAHRGSGDVAAIGRSHGVFEVPAGEQADEPTLRPWWPWSLEG